MKTLKDCFFRFRLRLTAAGIRALSWAVRDDRALMAFVQRFVFRGKPRAARHLAHYLRGGGRAVEIPVAELLAGDSRVRGFLFHRVLAQISARNNQGLVPVPQWAFTNDDWRYALGSLNMHWRRNGNDIQAWFADRYRWHAEERRPTQPLHRAAESLKQWGATEFSIIGIPGRFSLAEVRAHARDIFVPDCRRLYM